MEHALEKLKNIRLMVGTPMYGMKCHGAYLMSLLSLLKLCNQLGISMVFSTICNESLLQRSRNYIADEFMRSDCTHLLFVDTDIQFDPEDVITLFILDRDIVGSNYTCKIIDWERIAHSNVPPNKIHLLAGNLTYPIDNANVVLETDVLMTGFMMIKRQVLQKIMVAYPEYYYKPDHNFMTSFNGTRYIQMFFTSDIDTETRKLVSEYEFFCRLWRKLGGKIYTCPWMVLTHIGMHKY